jgi:hypothetical protein
MPIDTPYNRSVTNQYNQLLRDKVAHEEATLQTVMPSPAGMYVNGYEPVMVGSGVGLYKKGKSCPKGHEVCTCGSGSAHGAGKAHGISATICGSGSAHGEYDRVVGGNNLGLVPAVRVELALGAGMRGDATSKHGCLDMYQTFAHGGMSFNDRLAQSGIRNPDNEPPRICPRDMSEASIRCREGNKPPRRAGPKMPKKQDGTLYHKSMGGVRRVDPNERRRDTSFDKPRDGTISYKSMGGVSAAHYHRHRHLAAENANKSKALRQLGNGLAHGGKKGKKGKKGKSGFNIKDIGRTLDAVDSSLGIADKLGVLGHGMAHGRISKSNKNPLSSGTDKKKKESSFTLENLVKGIETAEKVGNAFEKVGNLGSKAYKGVMSLFGKGRTADKGRIAKFNQGIDVLRKGKTSYDSLKDTIDAVENFKGGFKPKRGSLGGEPRKLSNNPFVKSYVNDYNRHMASNGFGKAHGKAHGGNRHEVVRQVMNEKGLSMIEASKYVKAHNLY